MTSDEVWDLLGVIAGIDHRTLGEKDGEIWEAMVGDLDFGDALAAVGAYYREQREWIMPADIRAAVRAMQTERIERSPVPPPPAELTDDPQAYIAALRRSTIAAAAAPLTAGERRAAIGGGGQ